MRKKLWDNSKCSKLLRKKNAYRKKKSTIYNSIENLGIILVKRNKKKKRLKNYQKAVFNRI